MNKLKKLALSFLGDKMVDHLSAKLKDMVLNSTKSINRGALQAPFISKKSLLTLSSNSTYISAYSKNEFKKLALSFLGNKMVYHLLANKYIRTIEKCKSMIHVLSQ